MKVLTEQQTNWKHEANLNVVGKTRSASLCGKGKPLGQGKGNLKKKNLQQIILVKESFERRESTNLSQSLVSFFKVNLLSILRRNETYLECALTEFSAKNF